LYQLLRFNSSKKNYYMQNVPDNELERVINLAEYNLDYQGLKKSFGDLTELAATIAGTNISLINLIDSYTVWTVANYGMDLDQMPRADTVCQYTIMEKEHFEVPDMTKDDRFKDKEYMKETPPIKYYYGIPLNSDGFNIGALCVIDSETKTLSAEKANCLRIIANEIVYRLKSQKVVETLNTKLSEIKASQSKLAHDVRGPLSGIVGLTQIIKEQGQSNDMEEVLELNDMINRSSESIIAMADDILNSHKNQPTNGTENTFGLSVLKQRLEHLYYPQAKSKNIRLLVSAAVGDKTSFLINKLTHIAGNLIANAIKFTPEGGNVNVDLHSLVVDNKEALRIMVKDSGIGMSITSIDKIMAGNMTSTKGTDGEAGFGFGLMLVKSLIDDLNGSLKISSAPGGGTTFDILLRQ